MTTHKEKGPQRGEALGAKSPPSKGPQTRRIEANVAAAAVVRADGLSGHRRGAWKPPLVEAVPCIETDVWRAPSRREAKAYIARATHDPFYRESLLEQDDKGEIGEVDLIQLISVDVAALTEGEAHLSNRPYPRFPGCVEDGGKHEAWILPTATGDWIVRLRVRLQAVWRSRDANAIRAFSEIVRPGAGGRWAVENVTEVTFFGPPDPNCHRCAAYDPVQYGCTKNVGFEVAVSGQACGWLIPIGWAR